MSMGNPQVQETELAWLAGVVDGEGSISVSHSKRKGRSPNYQFSVQVVNTSTALIEAYRNILDRLEVGHALYEKPVGPEHKQSWSVAVNTLSSIFKLLGAVRPYMVAKRFQADRMVELVSRRMKVKLHAGPRRTYTRQDFEDMLEIISANKSAHGKGISETVRGELEAFTS